MTNQARLLQALEEDPVEASRLIIGSEVVKGNLRAIIVEAEAYRTPDDPACHAHRGFTPRTRTLYGKPGEAYVYFTYGNHWMLNVVGFPPGRAAAVLIRAAKPVAGLELMRSRRLKAKSDLDLLSGPGKLAQAFAIDKKEDGLNLFDPKSELQIKVLEPSKEILAGPRVGIAIGKGDELPWRFCDAKSIEYVSKPHRGLA